MPQSQALTQQRLPRKGAGQTEVLVPGRGQGHHRGQGPALHQRQLRGGVKDNDRQGKGVVQGEKLCILIAGIPWEQFKGMRKFLDLTVTISVATAAREISRVGSSSPKFVPRILTACYYRECATMTENCNCDPWEDDVDCLYLDFAPVNRLRLG